MISVSFCCLLGFSFKKVPGVGVQVPGGLRWQVSGFGCQERKELTPEH
jgi:hypothetical protein